MNSSRIFSRRTFKFSQFLQLMIIAVVSITAITAQSSSIDPSFVPLISTPGGGFSYFTVQPDGKILGFGSFQVVNGVLRKSLVRFNTDGTVDNSFNCTACDFSINSAIVQPNGKVLVGGSLGSSNNTVSSARLKRLNVDGSADTSFVPFGNVTLSPQVFVAEVKAIQPDGKPLVVFISSSSGILSFDLYRLNPNGTFDDTFTPANISRGQSSIGTPGKIDVLPDGKILILINGSGTNPGGTLRRFNADGTPDNTFVPPTFTGTFTGSGSGYQLSEFAVLPDGSVVLTGNFTSVNAISRINVVKFTPAGDVDSTFVPRNIFRVGEAGYQIRNYPNGKILISTLPLTISTNRFIRLNADGSTDNSFIPPSDPVLIYNFFIGGADNVFFFATSTENGVSTGKYSRLDGGGSLVSSFEADFQSGGSVSALAVQPDGKIIVAGNFQNIGGVPRSNFARINPDGTPDPAFNAETGFDGTVSKIIVLPNGKILVGGSFPSFNGTERSALVRLNSDGSLDTAFDAKISGGIYSMVRQADGKILIGGLIYSVAGQTRTGIARLNPDGSLDMSFDSMLGSEPSTNLTVVNAVVVQADGKIVIGGRFSGVSGFSRTNLVRLNPDGTLDATFNAGNISPVLLLETSPNGKYIVWGSGKLFRLNNDGTSDDTFQSLNLIASAGNFQGIFAISVQPDGSVVIGGNFTNIRGVPRSNAARLRANGILDTGAFSVGANGIISAIVRQPDGKLLVGGDFTLIENVTRLGLARLSLAPVRTPSTLFDFDGDGRTDLSLYRPSNASLYLLLSQDNSLKAAQFGSPDDRLPFADYDGDGKTDIAVVRPSGPGTGDKAYFFIINSSDNSNRIVLFGKPTDLLVPGDYDGDGKADLAVYRNAEAAGGQSYFYYRPSSVPGVDFNTIPWGTFGDKPVTGDFDGDGKLDAAVFRPSTGTWYILQSSETIR